LPYTWWKNKENLDKDDLIQDVNEYYQEQVDPVTEGIFIYNPPHPTQIQLGEPLVVDGAVVNGADDLRIRIPNKILAMGMAFNYQWFRYNPNYFCALGTKENFACGLVPRKDSSVADHIIELDGKEYLWPIVFSSPDGPFQQETGNFSDMAAFLPDYFPDGAKHDSYTAVSSPDDVRWATAVISSAISNVVNRETYWASPANKGAYERIVFEAKDPWAEMAILTFGYNRGVYSLCGTGVFENIEKTLASNDVMTDNNLIGVAKHVPTVKAIIEAMNKATDRLYNPELSWADIELFFSTIRVFYGRGVPSDAEWTLMMEDIHKAFDVLADHWGGDFVSYRYDFLTLLRVALRHLPKPTNPRPTGKKWRDRVNQFYC